MNLTELEAMVSANIGAKADYFLHEAERLTAEYQADNGVGDPADPGVFISWIATILKTGYTAGISIAFDAVRAAQRGDSKE